MARKKPGNYKPNNDTRRRSKPESMAEQKEAIKSDFKTQLIAERERWHLIGGLVRTWVRQALGLPSDDFNLKLYLDQVEDGFSNTVRFDPKKKIIGWEKGNRPQILKLTDTALFVPLEDGQSILTRKNRLGVNDPNQPNLNPPKPKPKK